MNDLKENVKKDPVPNLHVKKRPGPNLTNSGITLIALVVTIIVNRVFYDKNKKYSNLVGSPMIYINL